MKNPIVKIHFLCDWIYDSQPFKEFDEFILSLEDAKGLVNEGVAVIGYVYSV